MNDQRFAAGQIDQDVFAAAMNEIYRGRTQAFSKIVGRNIRCQTLPQQLG